MDGETGRLVPEMDDRQFGQWVRLLEQRTGMVLPLARKSFLVTNLGLRMREIGCRGYDEYYAQLNSGARGQMEWATLVDRLTVHETRFFRHPASMELVREKIHAMIDSQRQGPVAIQAWSAGCATGEEAYTLAMVINETLRSANSDAFFGITATDISQPSLNIARTGIYQARRLKNVTRERLEEYFEPLGDERYQVRDCLRRRICFARNNIMECRREPLGKMDIIYCQNVLIYFDRARRKEIVEGLIEHLSEDGLLILGSGEFVGWDHPMIEKINCSHTLAYRRRKQDAA